jgi:hypothetical protein
MLDALLMTPLMSARAFAGSFAWRTQKILNDTGTGWLWMMTSSLF